MGPFLSSYWTSIAIAIAVISGITGQIVGLFFKDSQLSKVILLIASVVFGVMAVAGSFYCQYQTGISAQAEIEKRVAMKDLIHNAILEANELSSKKREQTQDAVDAYEHKFGEWSAKTGKLIESAYGKPERDVFESYAGEHLMNAINMPTVLITGKFGVQVQHLTALIQRADTIYMRPEFDPKSYKP